MTINVFISYPDEYAQAADALFRVLHTYDELQCHSYKHEKPLAGTNFVQAIAHNLNSANFIVLLWGKKSATKWVQAEIEYACSLRKTIVPILVDNTPLPPVLACTQAIVSYEDPFAWAVKVAFTIGALWEQQENQKKLDIQQKIKEDIYKRQMMIEEKKQKEQMAAVVRAVGLGAFGLGATAIAALKTRKNRQAIEAKPSDGSLDKT